MKAISTLALSALAFTAAAQSARSPFQQGPAAGHAWTRHILAEQMAAEAAARTTGPQQRIVAIAAYNGTSVDSTAYVWKTTARTAAHNPKNMGSYFGDYSPYASTAADSLSTRTQYVPADSVVSYSSGVVSASTGYQYNSANKPVRITYYVNTGQASSTTALSYNSAGNNVRCTSDNLQTAVPDRRQYSGYDASNRLVYDTVMEYYPTGWDTTWYRRSYNAAGKLSQIQRYNANTDSLRYQFTYNSNGLLAVSTTESYIAGGIGWSVSMKDSIAYTGANPAYTSYYSFYNLSSAGGLIPVFRERNDLNTAGYWSAQLYQEYDLSTFMWKDNARLDITYNSFNNYETMREYSASNGGPLPGMPSQTYKFYYQTPTAGVQTPTAEAGAAFGVVPNPAAGAFQIRRAAGGAATYRLTDATGRTVAQGALQAAAETVPTTDLARGLYLLTVQPAGAAPQTTRVSLQ